MERLNQLIDNLKNNPPNYANPTSVKDWFLNNRIRVCEPTDNTKSLWFCLSDIANAIGDKGYRRYTSKHLCNIHMNDKNGRQQTYIMITSKGLYQYLLRSKQPAAEPFQEWVCDLLDIISSEVVTELERKLALRDRSIAIKDNNIRILTNENHCRMDLMLTKPVDVFIIERCYKCGIDVETLTFEQINEMRMELQYNEPNIVDELLTQWKLIPRALTT